MNPISKAIQEVKYRIPRALLDKAFVDSSRRWRSTLAASLEHQIEHLVIRPRVLVDCNLVGGVQALIPLEGLPFENPHLNMTVINIPKDRTQGRSIMSVLSVVLFSGAVGAGLHGQVAGFGGTTGPYSVDASAATAAASALMASYDTIPHTSISRVSIIAENTILVDDALSLPSNCFLRCVLENDSNMSNLQMRSVPHFCKLVELAVKAHIYNTLVVTVDRGELHMGMELAVFKTILESYADANENYADYLRQKMQAVLFMSDEASYSRFIRMHVGGYR